MSEPKKISELQEKTSLNDNDLVVIVDSQSDPTETKHIKASLVKTPGSFTVATPEEINTGTDNEKGVTPQGLRDSLYPRVYRQDEEPTLADGDVWVNTGEEELVDTEGGQTEEFDNGNSGSAVTIDWNNGRHQKLTLTDDCAITFTDPEFVGRYDVRIIQGGAGEFDITSIPGIFPDGQPTWTQGETGDEILLTVRFDGTRYLAFDSGYYDPS